MNNFYKHLLDSLKDSFVFVDTKHIIRYMNKAAILHYKEGASLIGKSIFDCHNEASKQIMLDIADLFEKGIEERIITDNEKYRIYMRAARDEKGKYIGYYERYEPPQKQ